MFELMTDDHDLYCDRYETKLFLLCQDELENRLRMVSHPAYCREGFSVIVSQAAGRTFGKAAEVYKYGHQLTHAPQYLVNKKGKLDFLRDGRMYFGMLVGTARSEQQTNYISWDSVLDCKNIVGAGIEIVELEELSNNTRKVYVVSAPARFATNTWTMSLLSGLARSLALGGRDEHGLDLPVIDFLFEYVNEVVPSKYKNLRSYQWSSTFGVHALWTLAARVASRYCDVHAELDAYMIGNVTYYNSVSARAEVLSLLKYVKAKGRNDLIDTGNLIL